jgi:hypothetical protein
MNQGLSFARYQESNSRFAVSTRSRALLLAASLTLCFAQLAQAYTPPVGIPAPPFGIDQSVSMYSSATFDFGSGPVPYPNAGNGPYTHYVDNKASGATDTNNPYGTPSKPRLTVPTSAPAGSVIEIHGGPYGEFMPANAGFVGTSTKPIFVRGYSATNKPVMSVVANHTIYKDAYLIIENIDFTDNQAATGNQLHLEINQESHHISVRYCDFHGVKEPAEGGGMAVVKVWTNSQTLPDQHEENVVIYRCNIYSNGYPATRENGIHGILPSNGTLGLWILENQIYNNGEDNIQIYFDGGRGTDSARFVYIGGNTIYDQSGKMENAVDVKQSNDVIISGNELYGYRTTYASDGSAIVLNNDAPSDRLWMINNYIHDSTTGIRNQSSGEIFIVGNLMEDINHEAGQGYTGLVAAGAGFFSNSTAYTDHPEYKRTMHLANNTFYHCDQGIIFSRGAEYFAENNIISELNYKDGSVWHLAKNSDISVWTVKNNLLYETGAAPIIHLSTNYTAASFDAAGKGSGDIAADPLFITPGTNFALQAGSAAINAGTTSNVYSTFQATYGFSIAQDRNLTSRPIGAWDIGAYEFGGNGGPPPPPPQNLRVVP